MRIWLDPDKLQKYALMVSDVTAAITAQNAQVSAGQLGGAAAEGPAAQRHGDGAEPPADPRSSRTSS
jgi:multidrug efflux pump subunit AcrB